MINSLSSIVLSLKIPKNTKFGEVSSKSLLKRKKEVMYYVELIPQLEMATKATFCGNFDQYRTTAIAKVKSYYCTIIMGLVATLAVRLSLKPTTHLP